MSQLIVYMTAGSLDEARRIAGMLVEKRLAACCNIFESMHAVFWWEGAVQSEQETAFIAKTTTDRFDDLKAAVLEAHSYDVPCIVALPIVDGNPEFLDWIVEQTRTTV
ncbi:divalent-cation tolerance protein CutA [Oceanidesulfovibrio marinus]|uniref:Divalent-cation tolerance protein CutA n=1 Tax=Oceanidesulfovibrio marinus TaxID=370038 RepID=A0A6P1ZGH3_9BACT|nr:divalent-cation tolerance protein CutA [Oceanidesulfovibrio marinus]QJT10666.1 divalent-cation tolerance protein CutA [Oceanidesulfovibrio marinus]TVM34105.1 divalent-cation tolerance protein CutA [Oceanidesulfovibrio marinus]